LITSNPNPRVLKIEKMKNKNEKENNKKLSLLFVILTVLLGYEDFSSEDTL